MIKDPLILTRNMGANAEVVDSPLFICPEGAEYTVTEVNEAHMVAGSDAGAVTLDVVKAGSGVALAAGTTILASEFSLKSTADTPVRKTAGDGGLVTALATRTLTAGQRLLLNITGTTTGVVGVQVTVVLTMNRPSTNRR